MLLTVILCFFNVFFMLKIKDKAIITLENVRGKGYFKVKSGIKPEELRSYDQI